MIFWKGPSSLRGKITAAYLVIVAVTILLGVMSLLDLLFVERQVTEGGVISDFNSAIQEMRRNEKNLFLYPDESARQQADQQAELAMRMLRIYRGTLAKASSVAEVEHIEALLVRYRNNLDDWRRASAGRLNDLEPEIRQLGHQINLFIERVSAQERRLLETAIRESRGFLFGLLSLIGLTIYLVGHQLIKHTVSPLKQLERQLTRLAEGQFEQLTAPSDDSEFVTLTNTFNHMLKELEIRHKRMMHSDKLASLGILASGVAHELNNPLSNISTSCQLLSEELEEADKEQLYTWLRQIDSETERGRKIVSALLDFGRHKNFATAPCQLIRIVNDTQLMIRKMLHLADTQLTVNVPEQLYIDADAQRIQQLLINIIQNALNAGTGNTQVRIDAEPFDPQTESLPDDALVVGNPSCLKPETGSFVKITISDNGPGISSENLGHVFDPFFTTSEPGHGVGLGLYIVREIVNEHDGCLAITSRAGKGTQVRVLLPDSAQLAEDQHDE